MATAVMEVQPHTLSVWTAILESGLFRATCSLAVAWLAKLLGLSYPGGPAAEYVNERPGAWDLVDTAPASEVSARYDAVAGSLRPSPMQAGGID